MVIEKGIVTQKEDVHWFIGETDHFIRFCPLITFALLI